MPAQRSTAKVRTHPLGEAALLAELGTRLDTALNTRAIALAAALKKRRDVRQAIAGYSTVTVHFDPDQTSHDALTTAIRRLASRRPPMAEPGRLHRIPAEPGRLHRIPVVYDGPDLEAVSAVLGLDVAKIVEIHTKTIYRVFFVGFVPGWGYLGPLPEQLELPRRPVPGQTVPAGSLAIAGRQTGIYPLATPGGWHLIGRTSVKLFLPDSEPPSLFRAGDRVKFFATQG